MAIHTDRVKLTKEQKKDLQGLAHESTEIIRRFPQCLDEALQQEFLMRAVAISQGETPR
jgi:hypothetical protein